MKKHVLVPTFVVERRLKMSREYVSRQVRQVVEFKRKVSNPEVQKALVMAETRLGRLHGEGEDQMGRGYFINSTPNCKYPSRHPFDNCISDKAPKLFANLGITKSKGGRSWRIIRGTFKVSFKRLEKMVNLNALPDDVH